MNHFCLKRFSSADPQRLVTTAIGPEGDSYECHIKRSVILGIFW